jgi:hypothetical protein
MLTVIGMDVGFGPSFAFGPFRPHSIAFSINDYGATETALSMNDGSRIAVFE